MFTIIVKGAETKYIQRAKKLEMVINPENNHYDCLLTSIKFFIKGFCFEGLAKSKYQKQKTKKKIKTTSETLDLIFSLRISEQSRNKP
jgi:hypothetical protein